MPRMTLVGAREIQNWANSRRAQEQLPALVRRLIHATTDTATHIGLPAGDAVQQGGYDGVVVLNEAHALVPDGTSIWELGVSADPRRKANEDYEKRKGAQAIADVGRIDPAMTTFVFVTPRRWNGKGEWAEERRSEGFWRDVRVLDVDDLESWLEQAPATHIWFSTTLGVRPVGADDLDAVWKDWSDSTTPHLSPALMFAGREQSRDDIVKWFTADDVAPTLSVESESPEETVALIAAAVELLPEDSRVAVLSRSVVVRDVDALVQVASAPESLRIIATFSPGDIAHRATRHGHRVLIPRSRGEGVAGTLEVPRLRRDALEIELRAMGLSLDRARELAGVARRSLMALRRHLATSAAVNRPAWASPEGGPAVLPMLLLGTVNEAVKGDAEALSLLSGEPPDGAFRRLAQLGAQTDPPVRRVGSVWYLVSKADAWESLSSYLTRELLDRFLTVAVGLLGSPDPTYELPPDKRWAASLYKKERSYSELIVRGTADTLALFGSRGGATVVGAGVTVADYAARVVRQLLEHAGRNWQRWAALAPVFTSLAEAAPDEMLEGFESGLQGEEPSPVMALFGHDVDGFFSSSPHTYVLWALERVAWSPDYLGRSALLLAELARRDPGGKLLNRPAASLRSIFLPWMPATSASVDTRLAVIDNLREREPEVAWRLMVSILPRWHDHNMRAARPDWRDWAQESVVEVTHRMVAEHAEAIVKRLVQDAEVSGERWKTLIEALSDLSPESNSEIRQRLSEAGARMSEDARATIWDALRQVLGRHRSYPKAAWAMPSEQLEPIAELLAQFEPRDVIARHRFLFSHHPVLPEGRDDDMHEHNRILHRHRLAAARAWCEALGIDGLVRLSTTLDRPDALGQCLAETAMLDAIGERRMLRVALGHGENRARLFGKAYLATVVTQRDPDAFSEFFRLFADESVQVRAEALLAARPTRDIWALVDQLPEEGREYYWRDVQEWWVDAADLVQAMGTLARYGRPHAALDLAAHYIRQDSPPPAEALAQALGAAAGVANDVTGLRVQSHDLSVIMEFLEAQVTAARIGEEDVARLELLYLPFLDDETEAKLLTRVMGQDPSLFVEAVSLAYRAEGEPEQKLDDKSRGGAVLAYQLLSAWRTPPGLTDEGVDGDHLRTWVTEARRKLSEAKRLSYGDYHIGQAFSGSPCGKDGAWPAEPVREVIETVKSEQLEQGLRIGRFNRRGVVTKDPLTGGDMERNLKKSYEADAAKVAARWPRTAAFLRRFAADYEHDAVREDMEAELRHDLKL